MSAARLFKPGEEEALRSEWADLRRQAGLPDEPDPARVAEVARLILGAARRAQGQDEAPATLTAGASSTSSRSPSSPGTTPAKPEERRTREAS